MFDPTTGILFKKSDRVQFATGIGMMHPSLAGCGWDSLVEGCCL
jgi:hypothetical protein